MNVNSNAVEITRDLVSFKTISRTPNLGIIEYLERIFQPFGFETYRIPHPSDGSRANLLCRIGPDVQGGLMLSGHTDVVPVDGQDWHHDPFIVHEKNGLLYGRGTADMKGFIAATCQAIRDMPLKNLAKPLTLLWTYDEEVGGFGSANAAPLLKNYMEFLPKHALIGEPTNFNILRMHKGHTSVRIFAKGKGAHSSNPDLGVSAIKALNQALRGIFELEQELRCEIHMADHFDVPFVTVNVGIIAGGTAVNIIPDEAQARVGFRPLPGLSNQDLLKRLESAACRYSENTGVSVSVEMEYAAPPLLTEAGGLLEKALKEHANGDGPSAANFCTDAGNLSQSGIECLIFGPGSIDVAHQANEYINKDDIQKAVKKLTDVVRTLLA